MRATRVGVMLLCTVALGCGGGLAVPEVAGTQLGMDFTRAGNFFAAPFPSEDLRKADDRLELRDLPNPSQNGFVEKLKTILGEARGFSSTGAIFFRTTAPLDPASLPDVAGSLAGGSPVFLVGVDPAAADFGRRYPLVLDYRDDGGPYGAANLLSLLPLQGVPLRPGVLYAAVVTRDLRDAQGKRLGVSRGLSQLASGSRPQGMSAEAFASYSGALQALDGFGVARGDLAGLAVFRTDDPLQGMEAAVRTVRAGAVPLPEPFIFKEIYPDFCVYESALEMPVYQEGIPPYTAGGGGWRFDQGGAPILQTTARSRLFVTIPRRAMPAAGYPVSVFIRTGGGGDRPLIDRGIRLAQGLDPLPGTGPALHLSRAGFAGISVDGPHGGPRNITGGDEQFLVFNIANPVALRDNLRQSALELILLADVLGGARISTTLCLGATVPVGEQARLDISIMALMGHSMGATIAPLVLAFEPRYRAAVLSGAGGSWIENVVHKKSPLEVRPIADLVVGYTGGRTLHAHDPVLTWLQWAGEAADPPVFARRIIHEAVGGAARHVLMFQGIVDTYILPPIANATSLSLGLDLAGAALDQRPYTTLESLLPLVGRQTVSLPASGNLTGPMGESTTGVVVQHAQDGVEDGHEVMFQLPAAQKQYRCFLESFAAGVPRVPVGGGATDPC